MERLFAAMADDPDFEYVIIDATIVRAHQLIASRRKGLKLWPSGARAADTSVVKPQPPCYALGRPSLAWPHARASLAPRDGPSPGRWSPACRQVG